MYKVPAEKLNIDFFFFRNFGAKLKNLTDKRFCLIKFPNTVYLKWGLQISELNKDPRTACLYEKSSVFLLHSCIWPQAMYSDWEVWTPILHYKEAPFHWSNAQRFMASQFSCAKCSWLWLENLNSSTVLCNSCRILQCLSFLYPGFWIHMLSLSLQRTDIL